MYDRARELYSEALGMADWRDKETMACLLANRAAALMGMARNAEAVRDCKEVRCPSLPAPSIWMYGRKPCRSDGIFQCTWRERRSFDFPDAPYHLKPMLRSTTSLYLEIAAPCIAFCAFLRSTGLAAEARLPEGAAAQG